MNTFWNILTLQNCPEEEVIATDGIEVLIGHVFWSDKEDCFICESDTEMLIDVFFWMPVPEAPGRPEEKE